MDLKEFADKHRVNLTRDGCADGIIPGKQCRDMPKRNEYRSHVYDGFDDGRLGVRLMFATPRKWANARKKIKAAGFVIKQDGFSEGCATFDPADVRQARLALKLAGIKTRRHSPAPSPAQLAARMAFVGRQESALNASPARPSGAVRGGFASRIGNLGLRAKGSRRARRSARRRRRLRSAR